MIFKPNSVKDILGHIGIMIAISIGLILLFFYWYLPNATNHGETITVPDLEGRHIDEIADYLSARDLSYEVSVDSGYSGNHQPLTVLKQYPNPQSLVKEKRKIYLTLNAQNPPKVKMPRLTDLSVKIARIKLISLGLAVGDIKYEPDMAFNAVLRQEFEGEEIPEGTGIFKGSAIDLVVGDGYGKRDFPVPDLLGMQLEEAEFVLAGVGLKTGSILEAPEVENDTLPAGTIIQQTPEKGEKIRIGEVVDIWVKEYEKYLSEKEESES
ncbi:PASTA domain-containing protein [Fulvivirgaceae bacterium BMA12]|uniref:PASTA domain-containing protein n=1 Tax=Agaribacillus aureus TaxID=3051825 RepID=A0ABT8LBU2_9BACT|nr:PASTA domain-containing protein [Fulvivirgaceae bacterium BMA12]